MAVDTVKAFCAMDNLYTLHWYCSYCVLLKNGQSSEQEQIYSTLRRIIYCRLQTLNITRTHGWDIKAIIMFRWITQNTSYKTRASVWVVARIALQEITYLTKAAKCFRTRPDDDFNSRNEQFDELRTSREAWEKNDIAHHSGLIVKMLLKKLDRCRTGQERKELY